MEREYWYYNQKSEEHKHFIADSYDESYNKLEKFCEESRMDEDDWVFIGRGDQLRASIIAHIIHKP
jgi:hypothetical protein